MRKHWIGPLVLTAMVGVWACDQDPPTEPVLDTGSDAPAATALFPAPVASSVVPDGPAHGPTGAIFTTTPDGSIVNENVRYQSKLEVYLDGGPRNDNPLAAGLDDGWYIFQVTDPSGKVLLSMDPAKCRVVEVEDGVIQGLVRPDEMGLGLDNEYGNGQGIDCHEPITPETTEFPGHGQHEINPDSDPGGGYVVQLMPFATTPNPGGVYKAWVTTWGAYESKVGDMAYALDAMPVSVKGRAKKDCVDDCFEPDPGFGTPRQLQKTDNFKVEEAPPYVRVAKRVDLERDGFTSDDTLYLDGWTVAVEEDLDDGSSITNLYTTGPEGYTEAIGVPFNTTVAVCEVDRPGWQFTYVLVDGADRTSDAFEVAYNGAVYQCVEVDVPGYFATIEVAFGNYELQPEARIRIEPQTGSNLLPYEHELTAYVEINTDEYDPPVWEDAPDGTTVTFALAASDQYGTLTPTSCTTTDGACTVKLTSTEATVHTISASATVMIGGDAYPVTTDGDTVEDSPNSGPATKTWINAQIDITPPEATNGIYEPHGLEATVQLKIGDAAWIAAPDGLRIDFAISSGPGSLTDAYCTTDGGDGGCTTTLNSTEVGTTVVAAQATITAAFVNDNDLADPDVPTGQTMTVSTDGQGYNSGPAKKHWIDGSLLILKEDAAGNPLGDATFEVCRTHDYAVATGTFTELNKPDCFDPDVLDNDGRDDDARDGYILLSGLRLGTYAVRETVPPENYLGDDRTLTVNITETARAVTVGPFINNLNGRMTGGSGKVFLETDDGTRFLTAGFTIHCDITLSNNLEVNWKDEDGNSRKWHIEKPIQTAICTDNPDVRPEQPLAYFDTFEGTAVGSLDGVAGSWVEFVFVDGGEPGKVDDLAYIRVWSAEIGTSTVVMEVLGSESIEGYDGLAPIKGNLQAHLDQPHGQRKVR